MSGDNDTHDELDRRSMLRAVGTSAITGIALTGNAAAQQRTTRKQLQQIRSTYDDPSAVEQAIRTTAGGLLSNLSERGLLSEGTVSELDVDDADVKTVHIDGIASARIGVTTTIDSHDLTVVVFPEAEQSRAYVDPADGEAYGLTADGSVTTSNDCCCYNEYKCSDVLCEDNPSLLYPYQSYSRECCECPCGGDRVCEDWEPNNCCRG